MADEKKIDVDAKDPEPNNEPQEMVGSTPGEVPKAKGIDLGRLRLPQDFGATLGVKKQLITVPVKKPEKQTFIRVHPDPTYQLSTPVLELKEEREVYLIDPSLWDELAGEVSHRLIVTAITRQGVLFLWPLRLPGSDGRQDEWSRSAMVAAEEAKTSWVRVVANMDLGAYEVFTSVVTTEPEWPATSFDELVKIAFRDRYIDDPNHPVLRRLLRGE